MSQKVEQVAINEANRVAHLARDAAVSQAYLYPIKGIFYLISHRALQKPLLARLGPTLGMAAGVVTSMFFFTYLPQVAALAFVEGPAAPISAIPLVLAQSSTLVNVIAKGFLIQDALVDTFDGTLVARDCESLVTSGREVKRGGDAIGRLGKLIKKPFERFSPTALIRYCLYLPLNAIPVVGTVMFILLQGRRNGPAAHERYFQLKGMSQREKEQWIEERKGAYASFGVVANLLELVPVAGILFTFSNLVGAALWAADLEKGEQTSVSETAQGKKEE